MFIDEQVASVEPICRTLGVSACAYYHALEVSALPGALRMSGCFPDSGGHRANYEAYGYRRTWKALIRGARALADVRCSG